MFRITVLLISILLISTTAASAEKLTPAQIQNAWIEQGALTGSFRVSYSDGTNEAGTFIIEGSERLILNHNNGARVTFDQIGVSMLDTKSNLANESLQRDTRLSAVFGPKPSFAAYVKATGTDQDKKLTMLKFEGEATLAVFFSNDTSRLTYLVVERPDGFKSTTLFNYE